MRTLGDPCAGPNHNNSRALPVGSRIWTMGYLLALTQEVPFRPETHLVFCSPDCMCDWHGQHAALAMDNADNEKFGIPGRFTLIWCTPNTSSVGRYSDWDEFTDKIGEYQKQVLALSEAVEKESFIPPFEA